MKGHFLFDIDKTGFAEPLHCRYGLMEASMCAGQQKWGFKILERNKRISHDLDRDYVFVFASTVDRNVGLFLKTVSSMSVMEI
jgi:hypothetical protein